MSKLTYEPRGAERLTEPNAEVHALRAELDRSRTQYEHDIKELRKQMLSMQALPAERDEGTVAANLVAQHELDALHRALREREERVETLTQQVRDLEDQVEERYQNIDKLRRELMVSTRAQEQAEKRAAVAERRLAEGIPGSVPVAEAQSEPAPLAEPTPEPAPEPPPPPAPVAESPRPRRPFGAFLLGMLGAGCAAGALWLSDSMPPAQTVIANAAGLLGPVIAALEGGTEDPQASPPSKGSPPVDPEPVGDAGPPEQITAQASVLPPPPPPPPTKGIVRDRNGPEMVWITPARFRMGYGRGIATADYAPAHDVELDAYLIGVTEVSFTEYDRYVVATGARRPRDFGWGRGSQPVVDVSWDEAVAYAGWLSRRTAKPYRLPSEAEWEYAARAGSSKRFWWGSGPPDGRAVCMDCGSRWDNVAPAPVGLLAANPFELHHTVGNVYEWVGDCYHPNYNDAPRDGSVWDMPDCGSRVARGGAYNRPASSGYSYARAHFAPGSALPTIGFRVARDAD